MKKPYKALREVRMEPTALSDRQLYVALMGDVELRGRSPSHLLQHLENLIGERNFDDGFLRHVFLEKLPPLVRTVLAVIPVSATIRELSEIADKVSESHTQPLSADAVTSIPGSDQ